MSRPAVLGALFTAIAVLLAGCSGGSAKSGDASASPSSSVEATGSAIEGGSSIRGLVVDDEAQPLAGATVGILSTDLQATSDAAGGFAFLNLAPGTYKLVAQKLGYESIGKSVAVGEDDASVTFILTAIPVEEEFQETLGPYVQFLACGLSTTGVPGVLGASTGSCNYGAQGAYPFETAFGKANNSIKFKLRAPNLGALVGETRWQPSAGGTSNRLLTSFSYSGRTGTHWWCASAGTSPTRFVWSIDEAREACANKGSNRDPAGPEMKHTLLVFSNVDFVSASSTANPKIFDIALGQKFDTVLTLFYGGQPPEAYSGFPDQ